MNLQPGAPSHLARNVMHFGRVLRQAGVPVGTDRIELALLALQEVGLNSKTEFHAVLSACMVLRHEHQPLFDQAFYLFWREPDLPDPISSLLPSKLSPPRSAPAKDDSLLADARTTPSNDPQNHQPPTEELVLPSMLTASALERLRTTDFEKMSSEEFRAAQQALQDMKVVFQSVPSRRTAPTDQQARVDMRATLRSAGRTAGDVLALKHERPRQFVPPLVVLADISGSMSKYSRMLLHFVYSLGHTKERLAPSVESFVFGTRLTRITPWLKLRNPDMAVARVTQGVEDWSGGTRISECLHEFNQRWARRVLGRRGVVLLVTDGLEHGASTALGFEMERLHKSCRRLIWLNPLLRFEQFEPKAQGVRAMLPHVDEFLPVHNLKSLSALVKVLQGMRVV